MKQKEFLWTFNDYLNHVPPNIRNKKSEDIYGIMSDFEIISSIDAWYYFDDRVFTTGQTKIQIVVGHSKMFFPSPILVNLASADSGFIFDVNPTIVTFSAYSIMFKKTCHAYYIGDVDYTKLVWKFVKDNDMDYTNMTYENYNLIKLFLLGNM